jgi:hypothetical protein
MGTNIYQEEINLLPEDQLHVLRHFSFISDNYKNQLSRSLDINYTIIETELAKVGSKFNNYYFQSPIEVLDLIKNLTPKKTFSQDDGSIVNSYLVEEAIFPGGIGEDSILEISKLTNEHLGSLRNEIRSGYNIKVLDVDKLPITYEIHAVLKIEKDQFYVITLFPGKYAPPFPSIKENKYDSILFWESNCFFKLKN